MDETQVRGLLQRVLDPASFFPTEGCSSLSKVTRATPVRLRQGRSAIRAGRGDCKIQGRKLELARAESGSRLSFLLIESVAEKLGKLSARLSALRCRAIMEREEKRESRSPKCPKRMRHRMIGIVRARQRRKTVQSYGRHEEVPGRSHTGAITSSSIEYFTAIMARV